MKLPTRVQNHLSVTLTKNILVPESEAAKPAGQRRGACLPPGEGVGEEPGEMCCPEGGREGAGEQVLRGGGGGATQQTRPPALAAVCAPPLSASCAKTSTETNTNLTDSSQAGDAHDRWSLCVPMIDARALAIVGSVQRLPA